MRGQHKKHSFLESVVNVAIGLTVSVLGQLVIFPLIGIKEVSLGQNLLVAGLFTVLSITRTYLVRRYFNRLMIELHLRDK